MDWDQDGKQDILSGSYLTVGAAGGHLQWLRGMGDANFEAAETIVSADGKPLENVRADENPNAIERRLLNLCTHQHAVDYDNDGDLDLVVGSNMDQFFLHKNLAKGQSDVLGATKIKSEFANHSVPLSVRLPDPAGHAAPHFADWDNDGDLDLLSGTSMGGVLISMNEGTQEEPKWSPFKVLIPARTDSSHSSDRDDPQFQMGGSTRVWATDFNEDGWLDLLVGDHCEVKSQAGNVSPTEDTGYVWLFVRKPSE